jgi:hypothetical protein
VSVFTPEPGGGTSSALTFFIDPPPALTLSSTSVVTGSLVTVSLVNGFGGSSDWLALATVGSPDTAYLQWTYVGAGVTNRTWTVTLGTGTYEFRLFRNNGYTKAATSPAVTAAPPANPVPVVTSLSPGVGTVGGAAFTLTVNGNGFVSTSVVQWNGASRPTTFRSSTQLQASIPAGDIAAVGTALVSVASPMPGGGLSSSLTFSIVNPPLLSVSATRAAPGSNVTVTLDNGLGGSTDWLALAQTSAADTSYLQWAYVGAGNTTRTWTVTMPATVGTYEFRLFLNGGYTRAATSPTVTVDPNGGGPTINSLSPASATAGGPPFALTVNGGGYDSSSVVRWNGSNRPTTYVSPTQLQAAITAGDIASAGTAQVSVFSPAGGASSSLAFNITAVDAPKLSVNATNVVGGANVTVTLTNGPGGSTDWLALAATSAPNTSYVQYTYVGSGVTTRTWAVAMPASGGTYEFRLFLNNGYTRAATSPAITVTPAANPVPQATSLSPAAAAVGQPSFTLSVNGNNFTSASIVRWNGADRPTTYVSAAQLRAAIPASDVASLGSAQVTVFSPTPGGGTSSPLTFSTVPAPILSVSSTTVAPGGSVMVTLTGGLGGTTDWLAFAASTATDTNFLQYVYVGAGMTTRTWTVTVPSAPGTYEFRLFLNNGYTRVATSPAVAVGSAPSSVGP